MEVLKLFFAHIAVYSILPFYFGTLEKTVRSVSFYVYLGAVLSFGGFVGALYSLQIADGIVISAGNLCYGAFMMATILLVITEGSLDAVKSVMRLVIVLNLFVYLLFRVYASALESDMPLNPFGVTSAVFDHSLWVLVVGTSLIIGELLLLLVVLEKLKSVTSDRRVLGASYIGMYIFVMCADGVLFPAFAFGLTPEVVEVVFGTLPGKAVMATSFSVPLLLYMLMFRETTEQTMSAPLGLGRLFRSEDRALRRVVEQQRRFLAMSEQQVREFAQRLSLSAEAAAMGTWSYDPGTGVVTWDERSCEIYGVDPQTFDQRLETWAEIVHADDREEALGAVQELMLAEQEGPAALSVRIVRPDGALRHVEAHALSQTGPDGAVRMLGVVRDVSERVALQAQHEDLVRQWNRTQRMDSIGQFAGGIAHDFNNLLIPIMAYSEMHLEDDQLDESMRHDLEEIQNAARRAQALIQQMLAFGRQQMLQKVGLDLNETLRNGGSMMERLVESNVRIEFELTPDALPVFADGGQIEQLLLNLVANARDAMPAGGRLTIATGRTLVDEAAARLAQDAHEGSYAVVTVSDTGEGMDAHTLEHLFEPFFTTKARGKGTGLGLATAFGIVQQHDGFITVESSPGQGASFIIHLPLFDGPLEQAEESGPESARHLHGTETILVVEDEPSVRRTICRALQRHGYTVVEAEDPRIALDPTIVDLDAIDLVLTDMMMPGMNGADMVEQMIQRRPNLQALFISGYTGGRMVDPDRFLQKPFALADLLAKVRSCLA